MGTQGTGRKRSTKKERSTAEDDALNLIAREAEARLAAKRAARAEAREIRMKELERQQKEKYYGLDARLDGRGESKWGDIEQWMEDSERYSRSSRTQTLSDDDERMSVGSRGSVRPDPDAVGAYGGGGSSSLSHKKSKKKKKHKHKDRDRNGYDDDYSVLSSRSSRLSDESRASRSSRLDLTSSRLSDDSRGSRASRLDLQPASYASSDLYSFNGLSSSRNPGPAFSGYQFCRSLSQNTQQFCRRSSLYEDSQCSGSRRAVGSTAHPLDYNSYRSSRASSRAGSARASPVDNCGSVASFLRSAASSGGLTQDLDDVTIPDFSDVEDRDYLEKGSRAASALTAGTLTSLGGTSSRRGSGDTALTVDAETSLREIKEIHELKDQIQDVELKYAQNLKEAKDALAEVEEKYRKAMVSNAQLDNEKNNLMYQVDTLKDSLMELEELLSESQRGHEDKVKELEREKHAHSVLQFQFNEMKETLKQSEELLNEIRQLRLKQEGFVREISDLQETVEWKDKKIGALERQKEYTDAIRIERDELREEVVKLKDILKKHGVVLGPDLNANGDMSEADVGRSSIADPASQSAADPQTSPSEGNSVLGNTEETHMRSIGEEELDPEPRGEMFEEAKANHLSSDALCDTAGVSTLETPREDQPAEEKECIVTEEDNVEERGLKKDLNVGFNEFSGTEAKDIFTCSSGLQEIAKSSEEDVQETPEGGFSGEKETKSIRVDTHTNNVRESCNISEEQDNKQQDFAENCLESTVSCHQQKVAQDVSEESSLVDSDPAVLNTEPQQEPENAENAENEEEEVSSKSQAHGGAASGKKKRKKRRGRKKGETQKDTNQPKEADKEKGKTPKNIESTPTDNAPAPEPSIDGLAIETLKESMIQAENEQDRQNTEEVDGVEAVKPIETFGHSEESRMEEVTDEPDKEQNLDIVTISETFSPTETLKKVRLDHVVDEQNKETETVEAVEKDERDKEQNLEIETIQTVEALGTTETSSHIETHEEPRTDRVTDEPDQEQILDTVVEAVTMTETFSPTETLKEVRLDHVMDEQNQEAEMIETVEAVETVEEDRTDPQKDKQDEEQNLEIETIQTVEALETTETCSHIETHEEPRTDQVTDEPDQAQILDTVVEAVTMTETFSPTETLKEVRLDHVMDEQNQESEMIETVEAIETVEDRTNPQKDEQDKEQNLEIETIQTVEALETTETFSSTEMLKEMRVDHVMDEQNNEAQMVEEAVEAVETVEEDRTGPQMDKQDEEQNLGTEEVEEMESVTSSVAEDNLSAPDLTDNSKVVENTGSECVSGVDNSNSGTGISPSDNSIHTELETVGAAEEATGLTDEMKLECETNDSGSPFERSGEGNPDTEPHVPSNDVITTESTNHSEGDTLMSLSSTDGFCDGLNSELSSATAAQIKVPEPGPKEETVEAHEEGGAELESERTEEEELNKDLKEAEGLVDPENSDCCNSPTFIKNCELFEKSPETAEQAEQQDDGEGQTSECEDQISKTSDTNEIINVDILNTPDSPEGTTETGHSVQQDHSPEDREHKNHQSDQQSSPELCPVEEQSHELSKDEPGDSDSSQPNLQDCEEDDEDEEGQSFDFDDLDVEAAIVTNPPISPKPIEDESNPGSLGLCQSNAGANENAGGEPVRNNDEERVIDEDTQETAGMSLEEASSESVRNVCENPGDTPEEKEVLLADKALVGELGGVAENQAASSPVEEGLIKSEQQTEASVLPQTADHVASDREQPQSRKDAKKKDKKGKAKSKEDCKMS